MNQTAAPDLSALPAERKVPEIKPGTRRYRTLRDRKKSTVRLVPRLMSGSVFYCYRTLIIPVPFAQLVERSGLAPVSNVYEIGRASCRERV